MADTAPAAPVAAPATATAPVTAPVTATPPVRPQDVPRDILADFAPVTAEALVRALAACGFTGAGYRDLHADLASLAMSDMEAWAHYFRHGRQEHRRIQVSPRIDDYIPLFRLPIANAATRQALLFEFWSNQEHWAGDTTEWNADVAGIADAIAGAGALPYVVIGDSHSHCYSKPVIHADRLLAPIHLLCSGGSALGLNNPHSRSGYGSAALGFFSRLADKPGRWPVRILFKFGQVDAEFVSVFRRIRQGQTLFAFSDFERFARDSVAQYEAFLRRVLGVFPHAERLRVCGVFPPALADGIWRSGYVNAHIGFLETGEEVTRLAEAVRRLEIPDLLTRTRMHALYNGLLQMMAARLGIGFIDDFSPLLSGAGVVDRAYTGDHEGHDHHLSPGALEPVLGRLVVTHATPRPWGASPYGR